MLKEEQDCNDDIEEQIINDEYKLWKKNTPFLYDALITHALEWPSPTLEWLPIKEVPPNSDFAIHKVVLGTHTSKAEQEQLIIADVKLPLEDTLSTQKLYHENDPSEINYYTKTENKVEPLVHINHQGEVNRARAMPQKHNIIATKSSNSSVYLFDYTKESNHLQLTLEGHHKEGYGLEWSGIREGWLASGSDDHLVCVWDVLAASGQNLALPPLHTYSHNSVVEDVSWSPYCVTLLGSVGDDRKIKLWDTRMKEASIEVDAHMHEINSLDFNKQDPNLLATGSSDKTVAVWDIRNMQKKLASLEFHKEPVSGLKWAPFSTTLLASYSNDRRVLLWDLSRLSSSPENKEEPPELLFIHAGHTAKVSDVSWNENDQLMMGSVAEDNVIQVWQMSHALFNPPELLLEKAEFMDIE